MVAQFIELLAQCLMLAPLARIALGKPLPSLLTRRREACLLVRASRTAARAILGACGVRLLRRHSQRKEHLHSLLLSTAARDSRRSRL
jgi:hypothetical protein